MNELFVEMTKLNNFGQRDVPPSHGIFMRIYSTIDDLIHRIDLEEVDILQVREELFEVLDNLDALNTQMTRERSAMWEVIDNHE